MKLERLTPEQESRMAEWREKWTAIGLSTEPANRSEAERGIKLAYAAANLAEPRIVWCDSPMSQGITRAVVLDLIKNKKFGDSVWASVWASVWDSVRDSVRASVRDSVWDSIRDSVYAYLGTLFPEVKTWKYTDKIKGLKKGEYPFQSSIELLHRGFIAATDEKEWFLLNFKDGKAVIAWRGKL